MGPQRSDEAAERMRAFVPHKFQRLVLDCDAQFIACICGAQAGKTTIGAIWLLREIFNDYTAGGCHDWIIVAPTAKMLAQATLPKFDEYLPKDWLAGDLKDKRYKEQKQCYELARGNKIFVRSGDEPEHIEGITAKGAWLDEPGQMVPQVWTNVKLRVAVNKGRIMMTSTPYSMNWYYRDVEMRSGTINDIPQAGEREASIAVYKWKNIDSPYFPREAYEMAKRTLSPEMFKMRYDGEFSRLEGLVYKDFDEKKHVIPAFPIPAEWPRFGGLDFGHSHPTACLCIAQKPEIPADSTIGTPFEPSKFYVYREYYKAGEILQVLAEFLKQEPLARILADPRGAQERDELVRFHGIRGIQIADNSIEMGIERVKMLFREDRLFFLEGRCPNTLDEIKVYHNPTFNEDRVTKDGPVKTKDDAMDALRYAFSRPLDGLYVGKTFKRQDAKVISAARRRNADPKHPVDEITGYF